MKKAFLLLIILLAICVIASGTAAPADTLTLPADMTAVEDQAFFGDGSLETVVLPDGIRTIGSKAFAGSGVKNVNLPDSLTFIADDAFDDTAVTALTVNGGTYAYTRAVNHGYFGWEYNELLDGTALTVLTFPAGLTEIGAEAARDCTSLEAVSFDGCEDLEALSPRLFYNCQNLRDVTLPPSGPSARGFRW